MTMYDEISSVTPAAHDLAAFMGEIGMIAKKYGMERVILVLLGAYDEETDELPMQVLSGNTPQDLIPRFLRDAAGIWERKATLATKSH